MAYDYELVKVDIVEGVATFQLNRPLTPSTQLFREIGLCSIELTYDDAVRAVVLTGGNDHFAAGADIKGHGGHDRHRGVPFHFRRPGQFYRRGEHPQTGHRGRQRLRPRRWLRTGRLRRLPFRPRERQDRSAGILLGIIPGAGGTQRLPRLIGPAKAKEMIYSGKFYSAQECLEMGLVRRLSPGKVPSSKWPRRSRPATPRAWRWPWPRRRGPSTRAWNVPLKKVC